jgi:hypothetical protein
MTKHWKYLRHVLRHKWFVFIESRRLGLGFCQSLIHDWQKFLPCEWIPYTESFYGKYKYRDRPPELVAAFDRAWLHHIHKGPHHWQYWLLHEDNGNLKRLEIPLKYEKEMLADWIGAGLAITGKRDIEDWYLRNRTKII